MSYKKRIYIVLTIIAILITSIVTIENSHSAPNAFMDFCKQMGAGMSREHPGKGLNELAGAEDSGRKWTVEELFRKPINFSNYYGEGESTLVYAGKVDRGLVRPWITEDIWNASGVQENLESARTYGCLVARMNAIPQSILRISSGISWLTSSMTGSLLGEEDFMVTGLLDIIGGDGESDGLIGAFFNSIYTPLVVIAFAFLAVSLIYKGLIQMKLRESLSSIIWSTLAFVIGVTLMLNPRMMVELPQKATSTVTTCVLGALNGQNCLTNDVTTPELLTGVECRSEANSGDASTVDMMINGMNCTIWKTFVLEPWAEEQFGVPYNQLYTKNEPPGGSIWVNLPEGQEDQYCVNLESSRSASEMMDGEFIVDGADENTVCNVALYQLYLQTEMRDEVNHSGDAYQLTSPDEGADYDARWFDIIVPMASDSSHWKYWAGPNRFMGRTASAAMGVIAVSLAGAVLIVLGIMGAVYKLTGVVMMAFAPLFLLFAIEPNRGRRIFLGWLETLISSILKYFAIAMLLVVSLMLYAGILNNTSGPTSFIAVIVLTVTLMAYRKEITDLIGATNMGGQRLTNKVAKTAEGAKKQAKLKGSAYVGGRIGGRAGAAASRREEIKAREGTISNLQEKLAKATTTEEEVELKKQISAEQKGLSAIGASGPRGLSRAKDLILGPEEEGKTRRDIAAQAVKDDWNKSKTLREGSKAGGKASFDRAMRRGTSMTAAAFRQKGSTQTSINRDFQDERGKKTKEAKEHLDNATEAGRKRVANTVDTSQQREQVKYKGVLSSDEKAALDNFANQIATVPEDNTLLNEANLAMESGDVNKASIISNEINARIRHNSIHGLSSNELAKSPMANSKYLLDKDLIVGTRSHLQTYIETGEEKHLDLYADNLAEMKARKTDTSKYMDPKSLKENLEKYPELKDRLIEDLDGDYDNKDSDSGNDVPESLRAEKERLIKEGIIGEEDDPINKGRRNEGKSKRNKEQNERRKQDREDRQGNDEQDRQGNDEQDRQGNDEQDRQRKDEQDRQRKDEQDRQRRNEQDRQRKDEQDKQRRDEQDKKQHDEAEGPRQESQPRGDEEVNPDEGPGRQESKRQRQKPEEQQDPIENEEAGEQEEKAPSGRSGELPKLD